MWPFSAVLREDFMETLRVLVVEDNPADARLIEENLKRYGPDEFQLIHEPSLEKALEQIASTEMDAVLLDLSLPETRGLDTLEKFNRIDSVTPVIILTGVEDEETALGAFRLGAQDYLRKSELEGALLAKVLRYSVERNRHGLLEKLDSMEKNVRRSRNVLGHLSSEEIPPSVFGPKKAERQGNIFESIDLSQILREERVTAHFQPWVSIKKRAVVGFEGLCRGLGDQPGKLISPVTLLLLAVKRHLLNDLDHLFRKKVLECFKEAVQWNPQLVLSVNFDISVLDEDESSLDDFKALVEQNRLDPGHIVVEILESHRCNPLRLKRFIENQRSLGFLIALDDIGVGYSNLDRIATLKPDLIKTDRALIANIDKSYHQQEVFKSIVKLSHGIGALVVAEGAETEAEALRALEWGADLIQGFYFAKPRRMGRDLLQAGEERIDEIARKFKSAMIRNLNAKRSFYREYDEWVRQMGREISQATPKSFNAKLLEILDRHSRADCLYVLDEAGTQMTPIVGGRSFAPREKVFFQAPPRGTDHSLKDYYYSLMESDQKDHTFVSEPYLSLATGKLCTTISTLFRDAYGRTHVLCVDIQPNPTSFNSGRMGEAAGIIPGPARALEGGDHDHAR